MSPSSSSPLLLVSDIVLGFDASVWREAFAHAGWNGPVDVHVHPGRTAEPPLPGGNHEDLDPAFALGGTSAIGPDVVVVGFGRSGPVAQLVGLGGRAAAVVTVDGLGGPFVGPSEQITATLTMMRAIMDDQASHALPDPGDVDPRLRHGLGSHGDERTAGRMISAMPVPMLLIETAASPVSPEVVERLTARSVGATAVHLADPQPVEVAASVVGWIS